MAEFEELYGAAEPEEPPKSEPAPQQALAAPAAVEENGEDLFLQLYGEAVAEPAPSNAQSGDDSSWGLTELPMARDDVARA